MLFNRDFVSLNNSNSAQDFKRSVTISEHYMVNNKIRKENGDEEGLTFLFGFLLNSQITSFAVSSASIFGLLSSVSK
jgi:hypothetical protein